MRRLIPLASMTVLAGCERALPPEATNLPESVAEVRRIDLPPRPVPTATNNGRRFVIDEGNFRYEVSYPAEVGAIPELRQTYDESFEEGLDADRNLTRSVWISQRQNGFRFTPQFYTYRHEVVANLPDWLSLSSRSWVGADSATDDPHFGGTLWDKAAKRQYDPIDLFVSKDRLNCAIVEPVVARLERETQPLRKALLERRREQLRDAASPDPCMIPAVFALILGSSNGERFDRIGVMVQPLSAGTERRPRSAHAIELTLPVTPVIYDAVKPEFRSAFAVAD